MSLQMQLCFLFLIYILCKVDGDVKLQQKISSTKSVDKTVVIDCKFPSDCSGYIHWYQQKPGDTLRRILYTSITSATTSNDAGFESFKIDRKQSNLALKIPELKKEHSAVYYCACWVSGSTKVFGSGTRLYVTDQGKDKIIAPKLSGYLPSAKGPDKHDKQTMLCQASGMFPDLVRFEWKKNGATWNDVSEGDVVEQRNTSPEITVTSILIVDKDKAKNNNYQCSVTHEGSNTGPQILDMKKEESTQTGDSTQNDQIKATCAPTEDPIKKETSGDSEQISSMSLFVYAYGVMLMKNALFFCVVSVFLLQRRAGKKDEIS
ncbi:hypothetical protein QQF64_015067 [Cirrhinus molitorella]|uniref:Ig-like domain-containing protein n=1 Tax=Cirrhinus molitorella TaxID=172907 RepID=A0ABR3NUP0_9TELE